LKELDSLPPTCEVTQPDPHDLSHFTVTVSPDEVDIKKYFLNFLFNFHNLGIL
jgi:hypothetical protein